MRIRNAGSSLVELMLFTPLALLAIVGGTDLSLRYLALSESDDVLRSLSNEVAIEQIGLPLIEVTSEAALVPHRSHFDMLAQALAHTLNTKTASFIRNQKIQLHEVVASIDPKDGSAGGHYTIVNTLSTATPWTSDHIDHFIKSELGSGTPSRHAIALGDPGGERRFLDWAPLLIVELTGRAPSLYPQISKQEMRSISDIYRIAAIPLRVAAR